MADAARGSAEKVGIESDDDASLGKIVVGLQRFAEGQRRAGVGVLRRQRGVVVKTSFWEPRQNPRPQVGDERGGPGLEQEREPISLPESKVRSPLDHPLEKGPCAARLTAKARSACTIGVVKR